MVSLLHALWTLELYDIVVRNRIAFFYDLSGHLADILI